MKPIFTCVMAILFFLAPPAQAAKVQSISAGLGAVVGYNVNNENIPWSPMLAFGFEYGGPRAALYADIHTLPFFQYRFQDGSPTNSPYVMATLGLTLGTKILRVGPFVSGGYSAATVGGRLVITPKGGPRVGWHGVEWRVGYHLMHVVYGAALYTWRFTRLGKKKE
jgi:hypothetical protein